MPKASNLCGFVSKLARDDAVAELWSEGKTPVEIKQTIPTITIPTIYGIVYARKLNRHYAIRKNAPEPIARKAPAPKTPEEAISPLHATEPPVFPTRRERREFVPSRVERNAVMPPARIVPSPSLFWQPTAQQLMGKK